MLADAVEALSKRAQAIVSTQQRSIELLTANNAMLVSALIESQQAEMLATASRLKVFRTSRQLAAGTASARRDGPDGAE